MFGLCLWPCWCSVSWWAISCVVFGCGRTNRMLWWECRGAFKGMQKFSGGGRNVVESVCTNRKTTAATDWTHKHCKTWLKGGKKKFHLSKRVKKFKPHQEASSEGETRKPQRYKFKLRSAVMWCWRGAEGWRNYFAKRKDIFKQSIIIKKNKSVVEKTLMC